MIKLLDKCPIEFEFLSINILEYSYYMAELECTS